MTNKPGRRADDAEAVTQKARTAHDYAVEHAEYMAKSAERLIAAIDDMRQAEADALDTSEIVATAEQVIAADEKVYAAHEAVTEGICTLQDRIYQFRKRADRAAAAPQPAEQQPTKTLTECPECQGHGGVETPGHSRDGRIHVCRKCRGDGEIHNPAPDGATQPTEHPPAPDVAGLVEALEECAASLAWNCFGECRAIHAGPIMPAAQALETAREALATHQKRESR